MLYNWYTYTVIFGKPIRIRRWFSRKAYTNSEINFYFLEIKLLIFKFDFLQKIKSNFYYLENQAFSKILKFNEWIIKVWKCFGLFKVDFLKNRNSKKFTVYVWLFQQVEYKLSVTKWTKAVITVTNEIHWKGNNARLHLLQKVRSTSVVRTSEVSLLPLWLYPIY
jgi:hypothetical protein